MPNVTTQRGGGYLLTLTCRCGAMLDRWVTPEEAKSASFTAPSAPAVLPTPPPAVPAVPPQRVVPPPAPATPRPPAREMPREASPEGPRLTPSPELEAVLRAALEAETPAPPLSVKPKLGPPPREAPRETGREGPRVAPSAELEAAMRAALAAEAAPQPAAAPPGKGPARPGRVAPAKLDVGDTVREALRQQKLMFESGGTGVIVRRPRHTATWIIIALLSVGVALGGLRYMSGVEEPSPQRLDPDAASPTAPRPAPPGGSTDQAVQAVEALRAVQSSIGPTLSLPTYQAKIVAAQTVVGPFLESNAPPDTKAMVREALDIYVLAGAAWQARSTDSREVWESIGRSPAIELCPGVKQWTDAAAVAQARGRAVATSISTLWECAERRIRRLDGLHPAR